MGLLQAYLGSSSDDGEAAQDMDASTSLQERYRKLLLSGSGTSQAGQTGAVLWSPAASSANQWSGLLECRAGCSRSLYVMHAKFAHV